MLGCPLTKKYSVQDYHTGIENWDAVEDNKGIMYFANSEGILEYDGVNWRFTRTASGKATRSFAKDSKDNIYVGADYDFGYLQSTPDGEKYYTSLVHKYPSAILPELKHVWKVFVFQEHILMLKEKHFLPPKLQSIF